jgi:hypothetical protein
MDNDRWNRLRGLARLLHDGVRHGADLVEKHHRHAAAKPFRLLESIPFIAAPTRMVRGVHDAIVWLTYGSIRSINHVAERSDGWVLKNLAPPPDAARRATKHEAGTADPTRLL